VGAPGVVDGGPATAEFSFETIVQSCADAIWAQTPDGRIRSWNPAAERLYGYSAAEMIGRPAALLVPNDGMGDCEAVQQRVLAGGRVDRYTTQHIVRRGRRIDVALSLSPITGRDSRITGLAVTARQLDAFAAGQPAAR
jgi:PAS domain S-box-containing protein